MMPLTLSIPEWSPIRSRTFAPRILAHFGRKAALPRLRRDRSW
jgi:hypothetical protein